jgi:hypothetical protein
MGHTPPPSFPRASMYQRRRPFAPQLLTVRALRPGVLDSLGPACCQDAAQGGVIASRSSSWVMSLPSPHLRQGRIRTSERRANDKEACKSRPSASQSLAVVVPRCGPGPGRPAQDAECHREADLVPVRRTSRGERSLTTKLMTTPDAVVPGAASAVRNQRALQARVGQPRERCGPSGCYHDHRRSPLLG